MTNPTETFLVPHHVSVTEIAAVHSQLADALASAQTLTVVTEQLASADLSLVQLLVAAQRSAVQANRELLVTAPEGGTLALLLARCGLGLDAVPGSLIFTSDSPARNFA